MEGYSSQSENMHIIFYPHEESAPPSLNFNKEPRNMWVNSNKFEMLSKIVES